MFNIRLFSRGVANFYKKMGGGAKREGIIVKERNKTPLDKLCHWKLVLEIIGPNYHTLDQIKP